MTAKKTAREQTGKISFRLAPNYLRQVAQEAKAARKSKHIYSREVLMFVVQNGLFTFQDEIRKDIAELSQDVKRLQETLDDLTVEDDY